MPTITIRLDDKGSKGEYVATVEGMEGEGILTFSRVNERLVIADHTGVDDRLRGKGVAAALAERLVADAREKGFKIMPLCPFVKAERAKHPEWADAFQ